MQEIQGYDYFVDGNTGQTLAVQRSTGEVTGARAVIVPEGTYFKTPEQQEADRRRNAGLKEKQQQEAMRQEKNNCLKKLGKYFFAVCEDFHGLTDATVARLVFLSTYLSLNGGKLYKTERTPLVLRDLPDIMKLSESTVDRFLKEASAYITVIEDGSLQMNNSVFIRGRLEKGQHTNMQRLYLEPIRKLYKNTPPNKHRLLGIVFRLLPYISREYNILCQNPNETCLDDLELLSLPDFCELIGQSYTKMHRLRTELKKLTFDVNGQRELFCNFVDAGLGMKKVRIFVNPHILYNGTNYEKVEILGKFCEL